MAEMRLPPSLVTTAVQPTPLNEKYSPPSGISSKQMSLIDEESASVGKSANASSQLSAVDQLTDKMRRMSYAADDNGKIVENANALALASKQAQSGTKVRPDDSKLVAVMEPVDICGQS